MGASAASASGRRAALGRGAPTGPAGAGRLALRAGMPLPAWPPPSPLPAARLRSSAACSSARLPGRPAFCQRCPHLSHRCQGGVQAACGCSGSRLPILAPPACERRAGGTAAPTPEAPPQTPRRRPRPRGSPVAEVDVLAIGQQPAAPPGAGGGLLAAREARDFMSRVSSHINSAERHGDREPRKRPGRRRDTRESLASLRWRADARSPTCGRPFVPRISARHRPRSAMGAPGA